MSTPHSEDWPARPRKGWAALSLTAAVPGLLIPGLGILAIACGMVSRIKRRDGRGMAAAGIVLGGIGTLFSFGAVLPSYLSIRDLQHKIYCGSNLKQIGDAILQYSNDNRGHLPPDFATLLATEQLDPKVFVCPSTDDTPAPGATSAEQASHLNDGGHLSYIYLGKGLIFAMQGDPIIAYELKSHRAIPARNVLFMNGSVRPLFKTEFNATLAAQGVQPILP